MSGHHLSAIGRGQLALLLRSDLSKAEIARQLGCHRSTVYRELARNGGPGGRYRWQCAQDRYRQRRAKCVRTAKLDHAPLRELVESRVREEWSPEQIAQRLPQLHPDEPAMRVSHETIYKHVYRDKRRGGSLHAGLRQGRKRRRKRANTKGRRGIIPNRTPIHERPKVVETQCRVGDWEGDTIIGRNQQGAVATFVDRQVSSSLWPIPLVAPVAGATTGPHATPQRSARGEDRVDARSGDGGGWCVGGWWRCACGRRWRPRANREVGVSRGGSAPRLFRCAAVVWLLWFCDFAATRWCSGRQAELGSYGRFQATAWKRARESRAGGGLSGLAARICSRPRQCLASGPFGTPIS